MRKINWINIEINEKIFKRLLLVAVGSILCYLLITFLGLAVPRIYHMDKDTRVAEEGIVKNGINKVERGSMRLQLFGWAYKEGQDVKTFKNYFILKNKKNEKMYLVRTNRKPIPELENVDGYNCLNCGMEAQSIILGLENGMYDLCILYQNDGENLLVNTGIQIDI